MATIEVAPVQNVLKVEELVHVQETKAEEVRTTTTPIETPSTETPKIVKEETKETDEVSETKLEEPISLETETKEDPSKEIEKIEEPLVVVEEKTEEPSVLIDEKIEETQTLNKDKIEEEITPKEIADTSVENVTEETSTEEEVIVVQESEVEALNNVVKEENKSIEA